MATYNTPLVTTQGLSLLKAEIAGKDSVTFTKIVFSSDDYSQTADSSVQALTALSSLDLTATARSFTDVNGNLKIRGVANNQNTTSAFYIKTYGLYGKNKAGNEMLIAVSTAQNANFVPAYNNKQTNQIAYTFNIAVSSTNNITLSSSTDVDVTQADLAGINSAVNSNASSLTAQQSSYASSLDSAFSANSSNASSYVSSTANSLTSYVSSNVGSMQSQVSSNISSNTTSLSSQISNVSSSASTGISNNANNISSLQSNVANNSSAIASNSSSLATQISNANNSINANSSNVSNLQSSIAANSTAISSNATSLSNAVNSVSSSNSAVNSSVASAISNTQSSVANNATNISNLQSAAITSLKYFGTVNLGNQNGNLGLSQSMLSINKDGYWFVQFTNGNTGMSGQGLIIRLSNINDAINSNSYYPDNLFQYVDTINNRIWQYCNFNNSQLTPANQGTTSWTMNANSNDISQLTATITSMQTTIANLPSSYVPYRGVWQGRHYWDLNGQPDGIYSIDVHMQPRDFGLPSGFSGFGTFTLTTNWTGGDRYMVIHDSNNNMFRNHQNATNGSVSGWIQY